MDERLDVLLGQIYMIKDDMDTLINHLKSTEMLLEYQGNKDMRHIIKAIWLMADSMQKRVETAVKQINEITK